MKLAYVAGPFRGANSWEMEQNIRQAETLALELWRQGFAVICPHTNTRFYQGAAPDDVWLQGDLEMLRRCDCLVLMPDWSRSVGARTEAKFAQEHNIPVFTSVYFAVQWLREQRTPVETADVARVG